MDTAHSDVVYVSPALFLLSSAVMLIGFFGLVSPGSETHPSFSGICVLFTQSLFFLLFCSHFLPVAVTEHDKGTLERRGLFSLQVTVHH